MKKSLILGMLGLAATAVSSYGQGTIFLNNYSTTGPTIKYGQAGIPASGVSGNAGTSGAAIETAASGGNWTVGLYYAAGSPTIGSDPNSNPTGIPSTFTSTGASLALGTGAGSTATINTSGDPGLFYSTSGNFVVPGVTSGNTVTLELIAYSGSSYATSSYRGHSAAFTMQVTSASSPSQPLTGTFEPSFSVYTVPEPSIFALSGIGAAALMLIRRKK